MSHTTLHRFLIPFQNFEKTYDSIPRKRPDRWKGEQMDGRKDALTDWIL